MSEFSFPPNTTAKKTNLFSFLLSDLFFLFCSFIVSHPLYFSYFIFFSPYIIKILSFLSPLFITTSLLLLSLLTTFVIDDDSVDKLRSPHGDDANGVNSVNFEDLEVYKIVFDISSSNIEIIEDRVSEENELSSTSEALIDKHMCHESSQLTPEVKISEGFLKEEDNGDDFVEVSCKESEKQGKPLSGDELKKVDEEEEQESELLIGRSRSKGMSKTRVNYSHRIGADDDDDDHLDGEFYDSPTSYYEPSLGSFGSMRKEKELRRTLACMLFEERHHHQSNDEGGEDMDMLWETYESDSNKKQQQKLLAKSKTKKGKKCSRKYEHHDDHDDDDDDDEEGIDDGRLCCLQALKFSAGKMNLGMGRPNLVKISKAFKGIGWLHNVTKHGKKISH